MKHDTAYAVRDRYSALGDSLSSDTPRKKLNCITALKRKGFDDVTLVSQAFFGTDEFGRKLVKIATTDISQLDALEILPNGLIRNSHTFLNRRKALRL